MSLRSARAEERQSGDDNVYENPTDAARDVDTLDIGGLSEAEQRILALLAEALRETPGEVYDAADSLNETVQRMMAIIPRPNPYNELIGPFYDGGSVAAWLRITKQYVSKLRQQRRLLGLDTDKGRVLYPSFQFGLRGELLPHLDDILTVLDAGPGSTLAKARWLNAPSSEFDGRTAAQLLHENEYETVLDAARKDVAALLDGGTAARAYA